MSNGLKNLKVNRLFQPFIPFYSRYPFNSKVSFNSADDRGCIDFRLSFFYNRIPKAANSTIMGTLASLALEREVTSREAKKLFRYPSSLSRKEVEEFEKLYKFTVVRDPYTRVLSAFLNKIKGKKENANVEFADFIQSLESGLLYKNAHWAPQASLLLIPIDKFDFIGKTENLEHDLNFILMELNLPHSEGVIRNTLVHATNANEKLKKYYSPELAQRVYKLYKNDFELFDYDHMYLID
ncbi:sulfotransferase family protein [Pleionea sediminis]|uniref:sulfotransferase family protein n=1 Tax=Pleionea sediminis TaxID=2569479 RepID=UPI001184D3D7|nr:sulfotransferase family protein [Pleionea sediminis]